jgi:hypothetical protein
MNTNEAKQRLLLYRGSIDDDDPQFAEALAQAKRDPELAKWIREQKNCYAAIRSRLREIEAPIGLGDTIVRQRPVPVYRDWPQLLKLAAAVVLSASLTAGWIKFSQRDRHPIVQGQEIVVRGEVLDMTCYIADHLSGPDHAKCARDCIRNGLPVGIKTDDGKVYLLVNKTHPVNAELADYAAKTITVKGKQSSSDGFAELQVEEIRKL